MMKKYKVLNLYAGIGGNRKLWENVEVTAVEINPEIAEIYKDFFPDDEVIITDAHEYLLKHYDDGWNFIWSSPPCLTHSRIRNLAGVGRGESPPVYPDMRLYQEIIFLKQIYYSKGTDFNGRFCVENVKSYYEPLIKPQELGRHYFWTNFHISKMSVKRLPEKFRSTEKGLTQYYGFDISGYNGDDMERKRILRNCVNPKIGKHIFDCAFKLEQKKLLEESQ